MSMPAVEEAESENAVRSMAGEERSVFVFYGPTESLAYNSFYGTMSMLNWRTLEIE